MKVNKALEKTLEKESKLCLKRVNSLVKYCPETGNFYWLVSTGKRKVGDLAGGISENGYCRIKLDGIKYMAHRLAWAVTYGVFPDKEIDHRNGVRSDNRVVNLREADRSSNLQNLQSARVDNLLSTLGVHQKGSKFIAQLQVNGEKVFYGRYGSVEEASNAYQKAKKKHHIV